ncbi:MAG: FecR domain-containing protein [Bacteroidales bacterium]
MTMDKIRKTAEELPDRLLAGSQLPFSKSKEEAWAELSERMVHSKTQEKGIEKRAVVRRFLPETKWIAAAASMALLLSLSPFLRYHVRTVESEAGERLSVVLPDGSTAQLNSGSTLRYHPLWWTFRREVDLEGEAYFEVEKGSDFRVLSHRGITSVLGTRFNVYARNREYRVECHSGRVRVASRERGETVTLEARQGATLRPNGQLETRSMNDAQEIPAWMSRTLVFAATPLHLVLEEVERQYGIDIETENLGKSMYSGVFSLELPVENVLSLLCRPFDLDYVKRSETQYIISSREKR